MKLLTRSRQILTMITLATLVLAGGLIGPAGADTLKDSEARESPAPTRAEVRIEAADPGDPKALTCDIEGFRAPCGLVLWLCDQPGWECIYYPSAGIDPDLLKRTGPKDLATEDDTALYDPFSDCTLLGLPIACDLAKEICGEMYGSLTCGPYAEVDLPDGQRRE